MERLGLENHLSYGELDESSGSIVGPICSCCPHTENFHRHREAAYAGLPVILTTNAPWDELIQGADGGLILTLRISFMMAAAMKMSDRERSYGGMPMRRYEK